MRTAISRGRSLQIIAETMSVVCCDLDLRDPGQRALLQSLLNAAKRTDRLSLAQGVSACEIPVTPEDAQAVYDLLGSCPEARQGVEFLRDYWLTRLG